MRKNKMMRLASGLLVAVLLTTCTISGTFAKYVTTSSASDVARVAKWGVELQVVGNLYGETYKDTIVSDNANDFTVQSVDKAADVVAPGTSNAEGFTFSLKGQPEVDGTITTEMQIQNVFLAEGSYGVMIPVDTDLITEANFDEFADLYYKDSDNFKEATAWDSAVSYYTLEDVAAVAAGGYYPVVYALAGNTTSTGTTGADSLKEAADKIATQLGLTAGTAEADTSIIYTGTETFEANTDLATLKVDGLTLTWVWAYEGGGINDGADTILGMLENTTEGTVVKLSEADYVPVVEYTDYCLDTQFSLAVTVTQAD